MTKLKVVLVTPARQVARREVDMITAPSVMGEVGILPDHRPLLTDLAAGMVILHAGNQKEVYAISGGFLEVDQNDVRVLAETAEHSSEIDGERSREALIDAENQAKKLDIFDPEYLEQQSRILRAQVRLQVAGLL